MTRSSAGSSAGSVSQAKRLASNVLEGLIRRLVNRKQCEELGDREDLLHHAVQAAQGERSALRLYAAGGNQNVAQTGAADVLQSAQVHHLVQGAVFHQRFTGLLEFGRGRGVHTARYLDENG